LPVAAWLNYNKKIVSTVRPPPRHRGAWGSFPLLSSQRPGPWRRFALPEYFQLKYLIGVSLRGYFQGGICLKWTEGHVLVTEFRGMALNGLFCVDVLRPLDLVPVTDFTYNTTRLPFLRAKWSEVWC